MNHVITTAGNIGYDAERHSQVFACDTCCFASQQGNGLTSSSSRNIALYRSQVSAAVSSCLVSRVCRKAASNPRYDAPRRSVRIGQHHMTVLQQGERHGKTRTTTVIASRHKTSLLAMTAYDCKRNWRKFATCAKIWVQVTNLDQYELKTWNQLFEHKLNTWV